MVDNFEIIKPLLQWRSDDDFYFLQILQRKKDAKAGQKVNGTNNNSRLVKAYYIKSQEQFDFIKPEVIKLCELFNARAGINLNRRSFERMALQHLKKVTDQIINKDYSKAYKAYSTVTGKFAHDSDKRWIIDLDGEEQNHFDYIYSLAECIRGLMPDEGKDKTICRIPSKNGSHIITKPFNLKDFKRDFPELDVHKNNPTNLYIP